VSLLKDKLMCHLQKYTWLKMQQLFILEIFMLYICNILEIKMII